MEVSWGNLQTAPHSGILLLPSSSSPAGSWFLLLLAHSPRHGSFEKSEGVEHALSNVS